MRTLIAFCLACLSLWALGCAGTVYVPMPIPVPVYGAASNGPYSSAIVNQSVQDTNLRMQQQWQQMQMQQRPR
jgi:hypothetical protein